MRSRSGKTVRSNGRCTGRHRRSAAVANRRRAAPRRGSAHPTGGGSAVCKMLTTRSGRLIDRIPATATSAAITRDTPAVAITCSTVGTIRWRTCRRCTTMGGGGEASRQLGSAPFCCPKLSIANRSTGAVHASVATITKASPVSTCRGKPARAPRPNTGHPAPELPGRLVCIGLELAS